MRSIIAVYAKASWATDKASFQPGTKGYVSSRPTVNALDRPPGHGTDPFRLRQKRKIGSRGSGRARAIFLVNPYLFAGEYAQCLCSSALAHRFDPGENSGRKHPCKPQVTLSGSARGRYAAHYLNRRHVATTRHKKDSAPTPHKKKKR